MSNPGVVKIHGREYETVASRIKKFREQYPEWSIYTIGPEPNGMPKITDERVEVIKGIFDEKGNKRFDGSSEEFRSSSQINKTSCLENCETSAIGRALAAMGLGGTEFASAEEVQNAIHQQESKEDDGAQLRMNRLSELIDTKIGENIYILGKKAVSPDTKNAKKLQGHLLYYLHHPDKLTDEVIDWAVRIINEHKRAHPVQQTLEEKPKITDEDIPFLWLIPFVGLTWTIANAVSSAVGISV